MTIASAGFAVIVPRSYADLAAVQRTRIGVFVHEGGYKLSPGQTLPPPAYLTPTVGPRTPEAECEQADIGAFLLVAKDLRPASRQAAAAGADDVDVVDSDVCGTVRFIEGDDGCWKLSRLAVLQPYRKYGLGRMLVETGQAHIRSVVRARTRLSCPAVLSAVAFYERLGWTPFGEVFVQEGATNDDPEKMLHQGMEIWLDPAPAGEAAAAAAA